MNIGQVVVGLAHAAKHRPGVVLGACSAHDGSEEVVVIFGTGTPSVGNVPAQLVDLPSGWANALALKKSTYFRADSLARCKPSDLRSCSPARCPPALLSRLQKILGDVIKDDVTAILALIPPLSTIVDEALAKQESRRP